jgi:Short C-terminal domain
MTDTNQYVFPLKGRGDKILRQNLSENERVYVSLQGDFGQALVLTTKHLYIIKTGFKTGQTFGGKCIAYEYRNITAVEIRRQALSRLFVLLTPATHDNNKLRKGGLSRATSAQFSDFAITFARKYDDKFQYAANLTRQLISQAHSSTTTAPTRDDSLDKLEQLAALRQKGIITEQEFQTKKQQLLGI